jgi:integrase
MRKYMREWVQAYPSITKVNQSIAGERRLGSERTVENYVKGIRKFVNFLGLSDPEEAMQKLQAREIMPTAKVDEFVDYALKSYAHSTVRGFLFGVKKWSELSSLNIEWNKIEFPTSTETSETDRAPTKEELKIALNNANNIRDRTAILLLTSSGLRVGTLLSLRVGDVDFGYPDVASIKVERRRGRKFISRRRGSQGSVFFTFMTPEAKKSLQEYLAQRKNEGENITAESPLITDISYHGKFISIENFEKVWARLLKRAGMNAKGNKWYILHLHSLRKYFRSHCIGIDASYREHWMGHKSGYLDESYFRAEEQEHLAQYRLAVPHLSIYSTAADEKNLRKKMLIDFAKLQGRPDEELRKLDEILARAKDVDEGIKEFRRFKEEREEEQPRKAKVKTAYDGNGTYLVAHNEDELIRKLHEGYELIQSLSNDKYLLGTH